MNSKSEKNNLLQRYKEELIENEKSEATVIKYMREVNLLLDYFEGHERSKASILEYREALKKNYQAQTVNVKLAAIHSFLEFCNKPEWKVKFLKVQRRAFADEARELTEKEYRVLLDTDQKKKKEQALFCYAYFGRHGNTDK